MRSATRSGPGGGEKAPSPLPRPGRPQEAGERDSDPGTAFAPAGNLASQRLLAANGIHAKLAFSQPGDPQEQEADRVAEAIAGGSAVPAIQRACSTCGGQEEIVRGKRAAGMRAPAERQVQRALDAVRGGGEPLPGPIQRTLGAQFGRDLSAVRIHADPGSGDAARAIGARAYTVGADIAFAPGEYAPARKDGERLLAHELTHVVQQGGGVQPQIQCDWLDDAEAAAGGVIDTVASAASAGADAVVEGAKSIVEGAKSVLSDGESAAKAAAPAAGAVAEAATGDPEALRASLIANMNGARARAQSADRDRQLTDTSQIGALNTQISALNTALPGAALSFAPAIPVIELLIDIVVGILDGIVALLLGASAAVLLIIAIIVLAIGALVYWLFYADDDTDVPKTKPKIGPKPVEVPQDVPKPEPKPEPEPGPEPEPALPCPFPSGLTRFDPIPLVWFKPRIDDFYPAQITLAGEVFHRDDPPSRLPTGEPIGVEEQFWPQIGKEMQLLPEERGPGAERFRAVLERNGFDWSGFQADHVQDVEFGGPDDSGFINLWPLDETANRSTGGSMPGQRLAVCLTPVVGPPLVGTLRQLKPLIFGRFFVIRAILVAPDDD